MQNRYYLYQRRSSGVYFIQDRQAKKHESLRTKDRVEAERLFSARNQAAEQPTLNISLAKAYLSATSPGLVTRTWLDVMQAMEANYRDETLCRWRKVMRSTPFASLLKLALVYTNSSHFLAVLNHPRAGTSTNKWLRILHNRALDLGWLLTPVMARKAWPPVRTKRMKAIRQEQHDKLVETEFDREFRDYLEMLWETGGSQTDVALRPRGKLHLEIVRALGGQKGFVVQPHRWIVERSFAWLTKCRRLVKNYERLISHSAAFIRLAFINLMSIVISS